MSNERQINYVNEIQNRVQNLYYIDDASELNSINLKENDKIYAINDNKLFQMEIVDQDEELSGSIVSFNGRNNTKIKSVVTNIKPVQDLHGYDNPWPAGGGKNKADYPGIIALGATEQTDSSLYVATASIFYNFIIYQNNGSSDQFAVTFTYKNNGTSRGLYPVIVYTDGTYENLPVNTGSTTYTTVTKVSNAAKIVDKIIFSYGSNVATWFYIQVESGSTPTAWSPYENICPISGHTGVTVTRTGKNLCDESKLLQATGWTVSNGVYSGLNVELWRAFRETLGFPGAGKFKNNTQYTFTCQFNTASNKSTVFGFVYTDGTTSSVTVNNVISSVLLTSTAGKTVDKFYMSYGATETCSISNMQIEEGSTATDYELYTGNQISVTFPSEADTVYSGTLTLNPDRTGTLVVDMVSIDLGSKDWWYVESRKLMRINVIGAINASPFNQIICERYKTISSEYDVSDNCIGLTPWSFNNGEINIVDHSFGSDTSTFKTAMSGVKAVYMLANPISYQLTAEQVSDILTTLYGTNNIWSDIGNITVKIAEKGITAFELNPYN